MAKEHIIPITNGKGSKELVTGTYNITASVAGYDNSSILPETEEITEGVNSYQFTISATGTLTLHVTDDGTELGIPIVGAEFYRCDAEGITYGEAAISDDEGNAILNFVPYSEEGDAPAVYYKQTKSDGEHDFDIELKSTSLDAQEVTVEILNAPAAEREINLTDANYEGLPIENGELKFTESES